MYTEGLELKITLIVVLILTVFTVRKMLFKKLEGKSTTLDILEQMVSEYKRGFVLAKEWFCNRKNKKKECKNEK